MNSEKELKIEKIKKGTVLDHLPGGTAPKVVQILGLDKDWEKPVSIAMNVPSRKDGKKDIVKIEDRILEKDETDKLGLIANKATINLIENYKVIGKHHISPSDELEGILVCKNPNCVTNRNEPITTRFTLESKEPLKLRCKYCERLMDKVLIKSQL